MDFIHLKPRRRKPNEKPEVFGEACEFGKNGDESLSVFSTARIPHFWCDGFIEDVVLEVLLLSYTTNVLFI